MFHARKLEGANAVGEEPQFGGISRLRFAVLCDSPSLEWWQAAALRSVIHDGDSTLGAVVFTGDDRMADSTSVSRLPARIRPAERRSVGSIGDFLSVQGISAPVLTRESEELAELRLDFILYLGFGGVADKRIAAHATHGLWLFRFGTSMQRQAYPPGIWEIIDGDPISAASLCRAVTGGASEVVLRQGAFDTIAHLPNANADRLLREVALWPAYVSRLIVRGARPSGGPMIGAPEEAPRPPGSLARMRLAWSVLLHTISRIPNLFFDDSWNVGIVDKPISDFLASDVDLSASWFPNRDAATYLADPMGAVLFGEPVVLCESYDFKTELGSIVRLGCDGAHWLPTISSAIVSSVHSSYPFLFEAGGQLLCVPESHQANEIVMYKAETADSGFDRVRTLISDGRYLDPTIFRYGELWWLFCTDAIRGEHSHLLAYHTADLDGEWTAHVLNPVKIDVRSSRPAGTPFMHNGRLYRPSQDCSRTYGGAVTINEISQLSPTAFAEAPVVKVQPLRGSGYGSGIHTLSSFGDRTLIDGKRRIFTGNGLRSKWSAIMRRFSRH